MRFDRVVLICNLSFQTYYVVCRYGLDCGYAAWLVSMPITPPATVAISCQDLPLMLLPPTPHTNTSYTCVDISNHIYNLDYYKLLTS